MSEKAHNNENITKSRKRKTREITVEYTNNLQEGLFEKVLADIYSRKVKSGKLVM